jgi:hypothetical protein
MFISTVAQSVPGPFSGFGCPRFCHFRRDTGQYRCGRFFMTILYKHNSDHYRSAA